MNKRMGRLISILYRKSQIYLGQILKQYDISQAEYPILMILFYHNGVTQEELATYLGMDKSAVTRVIYSLINKGFVTRSKDQKDQRCNRIYITDAGSAQKEVIEEALESWNEILMADIEEDQQKEIYEMLSRMVENVQKGKM